MNHYFIKRLLQVIPVLFLTSLFSFIIIGLAPGNIADTFITDDMTEAEIAEVYERLGMNGTLAERYIAWLDKIVHGNWGKSLRTDRPVVDEIREKLGNTILLMGYAFVLSLVVAIPLGLLSGLKKNTFFDHCVELFTYIGHSIPAFWLSIMLIVVFTQKLHLLPSGGMRTLDVDSTWDLFKHMIMPGFVLSLGSMARYTRFIRASTIAQLEEDYVLTARAKGTRPIAVLFRHVMKNTLLPIITMSGSRLTSLVVGSFIIESIFGWPGLGSMGKKAITNRDYPLIMAYTLMSCLILIIGNLIADMLYGLADPRIKQGVKKER